jgi:integrase/recombinase XerD
MKLGYMDKFMIKLIKADKGAKKTYTDEELHLLLEKPNAKNCSFAEFRTWTMINFLVATGVRLSSLINVKIKDLDFENQLIAITKTKNRKQQIIPMSKTLEGVLREYFEYRNGDLDDFLFCTAWGKVFKVDGFQGSLKKYNLKRGVKKSSVHAFRHTFAKKWILNGGDIFRLQKILGHSSMEMVKNYVIMFSDELQQNFEKFNPLDQMNTARGQIIKMRKGGK